MEAARIQIRRCEEFDYLIVNDDLESAHDQFQAILVGELCKTARHPNLVDRFRD